MQKETSAIEISLEMGSARWTCTDDRAGEGALGWDADRLGPLVGDVQDLDRFVSDSFGNSRSVQKITVSGLPPV